MGGPLRKGNIIESSILLFFTSELCERPAVELSILEIDANIKDVQYPKGSLS